MIADADQDGVTIEEWLENLSEKDRQRNHTGSTSVGMRHATRRGIARRK
jgi:hypothetical protein